MYIICVAFFPFIRWVYDNFMHSLIYYLNVNIFRREFSSFFHLLIDLFDVLPYLFLIYYFWETKNISYNCISTDIDQFFIFFLINRQSEHWLLVSPVKMVHTWLSFSSPRVMKFTVSSEDPPLSIPLVLIISTEIDTRYTTCNNYTIVITMIMMWQFLWSLWSLP